MPESTQCGGTLQWGRRGLTLVESVIAIVILAVLVALLLPGFDTLLAKSRSIRCAKNLQQIGVAFNLYAADNNGAVPPYRLFVKLPDGTESRQEIWTTALSRSMKLSPEIQSCPSERKPFKAGHFYHYAMTASGISRLSAVKEPSKRFLVGESKGAVRMTTVANVVDSVMTPVDFAFRHNQRSNLLFLDGHVETRPVEEIPLIQQKGTPEYRDFWTQ